MTATEPRLAIAASGAELVGLSEQFYRRAFAGALSFVSLAAAAALVLLPFRSSASDVGATTPTVLVAALLVLAGPFAVRRATRVYLALRGDPRLEWLPVLLSGALIAYPLRSELWWPACALLMLLAVVAPLARTLVYCGVVLAANLGAHVIAGDLGETPAVAIVGLWIGFGFWSSTVAVFSDRIAAYLLRIDTARLPVAGPAQLAPEPEGEPDDAVVVETRLLPAPREPSLERLTARQLQVTALLADGLRYRQIAACLGISPRQVQRHAADAVRRLGVANVNELVAVALANGLIAPNPS